MVRDGNGGVGAIARGWRRERCTEQMGKNKRAEELAGQMLGMSREVSHSGHLLFNPAFSLSPSQEFRDPASLI